MPYLINWRKLTNLCPKKLSSNSFCHNFGVTHLKTKLFRNTFLVTQNRDDTNWFPPQVSPF